MNTEAELAPASEPISRPATISEIISRVKAESKYNLQAVCISMAQAIRESTSVYDIAVKCAESMPPNFLMRTAWMKKNPIRDIAHLYSVCTAASVLGHDLIDVEGSLMGKMFGSADLVFFEGDFIVLDDFTSSDTMRPEKISRLITITENLSRMFPEAKFRCQSSNVLQFDKKFEVRQYCVHPNSDESQFHFDFVDAIHNAGLEDPDFVRVVLNSMQYEKRVNVKSPRDSEDIAHMLPKFESLKQLLIHSQVRYPKLVDKLLKSAEHLPSFCRGMPVPKADQESTSLPNSKGWSKLLYDIIDVPDGESLSWSPFNGVKRSAYRKPGLIDTSGPAVVLNSKGGGFVTFSVSTKAPEDWIDFVRREQTPQALYPAPDKKSIDEFVSHYLLLESTMKEYEKVSDLDMPDVLDRASKLLKDHVSPSGSAFAHSLASQSLKECSSTIGYKMLSLARIIAANALEACKLSRCSHAAYVTKSLGGLVVQITKATGPLEVRNDTCALIAVSQPEEAKASWERKREFTSGNCISESKCIFLPFERLEWFSEAPGAVAGMYTAYIDSSMKGRCSAPDYSASCALACLADRKPFAVSLSIERQMLMSNVSLDSDSDELAKKFEHTNMMGLEQLLMSRMIIRGLALGVNRDSGTLDKIVKVSSNGRKSIQYAPLFARSGQVDCMGTINCFYDCSVSNGQSSSKMLAVFKAIEKAIEGKLELDRQKREDPELVWRASPESVNAWQNGELDVYVRTQAFRESEKKYAIEVARHARKWTCSLYCIYVSARNTSFGTDYNTAYNEECMKDVSEMLSTKKARDRRAKFHERGNDVSVCVHGRRLLEHASTKGRMYRSFNTRNISESLRSQNVHLSASRDACAIRSMERLELGETIECYVQDKDGAIEATRDIASMDEIGRPLQFISDSASRRVGASCRNSALSEKSKIRVIRGMETEVRVPAKHVMLKVGTDVSTYGPTKDPAALYAVHLAVGCEGDLRSFIRDFFVSLTQKVLIPPSNYISNADAHAASLSRRGVIGGINFEHQLRLMKDSGWRMEIPVGTFQGLTQSSSDVVSAVKSRAIELYFADFFGTDCRFVSTNDDALGMVVVSMTDAFISAGYIKQALSRIGALFGEVLNKAKLFISSMLAELNTQMSFNGIPALAYVRSTVNSAGVSTCASPRLSAISVLTSTNTAVAEGAPMFCLLSSLAISWTVHYERFRMSELSYRNEFPSHDCLRLGPPVFNPIGVFGYGPHAIVAATNVSVHRRNRDEQIDLLCNIAAARYPEGVDRSSWTAETVSEAPDRTMFTDYVFTTHPVDKILNDDRISELVDERQLILKLATCPRLSIGDVLMNALAIMSGMRRESPFRATSSLVANASCAFAIENLRISAVDYQKDNISIVRGSRRLTFAEFIDELSESRHDYRVEWKGDKAVRDAFARKVESAINLASMLSTASKWVKRRPRAMDQSYTHEFETAVKPEAVLSYAAKMNPSLMSDIHFSLLIEGVYSQSFNIPTEPSYVLDEVTRSVTNLFSTLNPKNPPPALVPSECRDADLTTKLAGMAVKNLGYNRSAEMTAQGKAIGLRANPKFTGLSDTVPRIAHVARTAMDKALRFSSEIGSLPCEIPHSLLSSLSLRLCNDETLTSFMSSAPSKNILVKEIELLATHGCRLLLNSDQVTLLAKLKGAGIMRRFMKGIAVACETNLSMYRRKDKMKKPIDYVATKVRRSVGPKFVHELHVLSDLDPAELVVSRKSSKMRRTKGSLMIGDMEVFFHPFPDFIKPSAFCYPPCLGFVASDIPYILSDLRQVDDSTREFIHIEPSVAISKPDSDPGGMFDIELGIVMRSREICEALGTSFISDGIVSSLRTLAECISKSRSSVYTSLNAFRDDKALIEYKLLSDDSFVKEVASQGYMSAVIQSTTDGMSIKNAVDMVLGVEQDYEEEEEYEPAEDEPVAGKRKYSMFEMISMMEDAQDEESEEEMESEADSDLQDALGLEGAPNMQMMGETDDDIVDDEDEEPEEIVEVMDMRRKVYEAPTVYKACVKAIRAAALDLANRNKRRGRSIVLVTPAMIATYAFMEETDRPLVKYLASESVQWMGCLNLPEHLDTRAVIFDDLVKEIKNPGDRFVVASRDRNVGVTIADKKAAREFLYKIKIDAEARVRTRSGIKYNSLQEMWFIDTL